MGILSRASTIFKAKVSKALDNAEDPRETLDYSYEKQLEYLQKVRRSLADVVTAKKQVELSKARLDANVKQLEDEAKMALSQGREDLARAALERKQALVAESAGLDAQIQQLNEEQTKMTETEKRLTLKIEAFRTKKEVIKAQYSSAEAQVKLGEAASGISEEMADVGLAVQRAQDKTDRMRSRASAIDELVDQGSLTDALSGDNSDPTSRELAQVASKGRVDADLERLKSEMGQSK